MSDSSSLSAQLKQIKQSSDLLAHHFESVIKPVTDKLSGMLPKSILDPEFIAKLPKAHKEFVRRAEVIGSAGWTIPMWMDFSDVHKAYDAASHSRLQLDEYYLDFYRSKRGVVEFENIVNTLISAKNTDRWKPLLRESKCAFDAGHFVVCVPALLSILEGLLLENAGKLGTRTGPKQVAGDKKEDSSDAFVVAAIDANMYNFICVLYKDHDFGKKEPEMLNRHWVLHGRCLPTTPEADAIRLFQALEQWAR